MPQPEHDIECVSVRFFCLQVFVSFLSLSHFYLVSFTAVRRIIFIVLTAEG